MIAFIRTHFEEKKLLYALLKSHPPPFHPTKTIFSGKMLMNSNFEIKAQ